MSSPAMQTKNCGGLAPSGGAAGAQNPTFDYIVVGGGSSGAVLASRLSEDPRFSVLLLEAGPVEPSLFDVNTIFSMIPAGFTQLQKTAVDWQFKTQPQPELASREVPWPRGKVIGGCSSINALFYVRGDPRNYDEWEQLHGCEGWGYEDVLPYFKKSEDCLATDLDQQYHGSGGPLKVDRVTRGRHSPWSERFVQAAGEMGIPPNEDYNGPQQTGVGLGFVTSDNGRRCDSSLHFLSPEVRRRPNLTVQGLTHVTKVVLSDSGRRAIGVVCREGSTDIAVLRKRKDVFYGAARQVVLAAGAVGSPWIMLLSGIGDREELEAKDVACLVDLPGVGKNLQDHLLTYLSYSVKDQETYNPYRAIPGIGSIKAIMQWTFWRSGPGTSSGLEASAFLNSGLRRNPPGSLNPNDLQIHFFPATPDEHLRNSFGHEIDPARKDPPHGISIVPALLLPKSKGFLALASSDPFAYPTIEPNYFSDPENYDFRLMMFGMKLARRVARAPSFRGLVGEEVLEPSIRHPPESDEYLEEYIRRFSNTIYHPVGTCKMGGDPESDPLVVCDPQLRVRGVEGLRVADASIMPTLMSGNTNAPCIMIAEKAADMIIHERGSGSSRGVGTIPLQTRL